MIGLARGLVGIYWHGRQRDGVPVEFPHRCPVCGSSKFLQGAEPPEWAEIFANMDPAPGEMEALLRREHLHCARCRANLRSMALARGICAAQGWRYNLVSLLASRPWLRLLEVNRSYIVGDLLRLLPHLVAADYPEIDVEALPFPDSSFRLVVHSDTLEHVQDPERALRECSRVLRPGGSMVFTVPLRPAPETRNRAGMPEVFHGDNKPPYRSLVHTDFGADLWTMVLAAGFADFTIVSLEHPAGSAYVARKDTG